MATNNKGKIEEMKKMLKDFLVFSQKEEGIELDVEENGETFLDNAILKARALKEVIHDNYSYILAEDSGICIEALGGYPGVKTKRAALEELAKNLSNEERNEYYLEKIKNNSNRNVKWQTAIVLIEPHGKETHFIGEVDGTLPEVPIGDNGFGFDPIFYINEEGKTLAQMSFEEKEKYSARKRAIEKLIKYLK